MTDPIRAALDAAAEATCPTARTAHGPCAPLCVHCPRIAAKAITAFLRALKDGDVLTLLKAEKDPHYGWRDTLADAVLAAAKEEDND